jgi:hypothetical protein
LIQKFGQAPCLTTKVAKRLVVGELYREKPALGIIPYPTDKTGMGLLVARK